MSKSAERFERLKELTKCYVLISRHHEEIENILFEDYLAKELFDIENIEEIIERCKEDAREQTNSLEAIALKQEEVKERLKREWMN